MGAVLKLSLLLLVAVAYVSAYDDDDDDLAVDGMLDREKRAIDEDNEIDDEASENVLVREKRGGYCPPCPRYTYCKDGRCVCNAGYRRDSYGKCVKSSYTRRRYGRRYRRGRYRRGGRRYVPSPPYRRSGY